MNSKTRLVFLLEHCRLTSLVFYLFVSRTFDFFKASFALQGRWLRSFARRRWDQNRLNFILAYLKHSRKSITLFKASPSGRGGAIYRDGEGNLKPVHVVSTVHSISPQTSHRALLTSLSTLLSAHAASPSKIFPYRFPKTAQSTPSKNKMFSAVLTASSVFLLSDLSE